MKKKLVAFLVCLCLALGAASSITAFAGVNTNSPVGDKGLITGGGLDKNFMIKGDNADSSAYAYQMGNSTFCVGDPVYIGTRQAIGKGRFDATKYGGYIVTRFDLYGNPFTNGKQFALGLGTSLNNTSFGFMHFGIASGKYAVPYGAFASKDCYNYGSTEKVTNHASTFKLGIDNETVAAHRTGDREYVTYWIEINYAPPTEEQGDTNPNLGDAKVYCGYVQYNEDGTETVVEKQEYGTVKAMFSVPTAKAYLTILWNQAADLEIDNYKTYRYGGNEASPTEEFSSHNFSDSKVYYNIGGYEDTSIGEGANVLAVTANGAFGEKTYVKTYDSQIMVTNPGEDARIVSVANLAVDGSFEPTVELEARLKLVSVDTSGDSVRKVGLALGLYDEEEALKKPDGGASFIYLTVDNGNVVLGAQNIASDGAVTELLAEPVVIGKAALTAAAAEETTEPETPAEPEVAYVGESAPYISLRLVGKMDGSADLFVNGSDTPVSVPSLKLSGRVAIAQTGTGNVTYYVDPSFNVVGYQFTANEGEAVTASFDANHISEGKFEYKSTPAPANHTVATETSLPQKELVAENGKLGFYGTSTNTRVIFNKSYSDFALQFDFISIPYAKRGKMPGLGLGSNVGDKAFRNVSLYAMFGGESPSSATTQYNLISIIEGNPTNAMWGAESICLGDGKFAGKLSGGASTSWRDVTEDDDLDAAIDYYEKNAGDPVKKMPSDATNTFYNKTTRFKLIVINNNVAMYAANVNEDGTLADEYRLVGKGRADNTLGYVGIGTESPAWCEVDNLAITPIDKETVLASELEFTPAADFVADVTEFETDAQPVALEKPAVTVDPDAKKITWGAVEGAKDYTVTVKYDFEVLKTETVTALEYDMSAFTETAEAYSVTVTANAENTAIHKSSATTVDYSNASGSGSGSGNGKGDSGCGCGSSVGFSLGSAAIVLLGAAVLMIVAKRKTAK